MSQTENQKRPILQIITRIVTSRNDLQFLKRKILKFVSPPERSKREAIIKIFSEEKQIHATLTRPTPGQILSKGTVS